MAAQAPARRTRTTTTVDELTPRIVVPRGKSAAEQRLGALAALHQPVARQSQRILASEPIEVYYVCGECKAANDMGRLGAARWPCATARLLGDWPGCPAT